MLDFTSRTSLHWPIFFADAPRIAVVRLHNRFLSGPKAPGIVSG
jgi:hypothetical protein